MFKKKSYDQIVAGFEKVKKELSELMAEKEREEDQILEHIALME